MPRPLTHQLALNIVDELGWRVESVDIVDLRNNTFYAEILLHANEGDATKALDARPSDAIALALRAGVPIRVAESVLEQVRIDKALDKLPEPDEDEDEDEDEEDE